jgi:predicted lipid-binding transport protein (Tim44 family)
MSGDVATSLVSSLLAGMYLALMFRYDAGLTGIVIAIALLNATALRYVAKRRSQDSQRIAKGAAGAVAPQSLVSTVSRRQR